MNSPFPGLAPTNLLCYRSCASTDIEDLDVTCFRWINRCHFGCYDFWTTIPNSIHILRTKIYHHINKTRLGNGITFRPEPSIKVVGVTIDDRLQFSEHFSDCYLKRAWQLMIPWFPDISIWSQNLWSITASYRVKQGANRNQLGKFWERSLRILYNDFDSPVLNISFWKFSSHLVNWIHPVCMICSFSVGIPKQLIGRNTNYDLRTFSCLGSRLCNKFSSVFDYTCDTDIAELRDILQQLEESKSRPLQPKQSLNLC